MYCSKSVAVHSKRWKEEVVSTFSLLRDFFVYQNCKNINNVTFLKTLDLYQRISWVR